MAYLHILLDLLPIGLDVDIAVVGRHQDRESQVLVGRVAPCRSQY